MKFLGISMLISAILLSSAIVVNGLLSRYEILETENGPTRIFDKLTGTYYYKHFVSERKTTDKYNVIDKYKSENGE